MCSVLLGGKDEIDGGMGTVFCSTWGPCVLFYLGARTRSTEEWAVCSILLGGKDEIDGGMGRVFYSTWGQGRD